MRTPFSEALAGLYETTTTYDDVNAAALQWLNRQLSDGFRPTTALLDNELGMLIVGLEGIALYFPHIKCGASTNAACYRAAQLIEACGFPPQGPNIIADIMALNAWMVFVELDRLPHLRLWFRSDNA